jgi:hypothetical protein
MDLIELRPVSASSSVSTFSTTWPKVRVQRPDVCEGKASVPNTWDAWQSYVAAFLVVVSGPAAYWSDLPRPPDIISVLDTDRTSAVRREFDALALETTAPNWDFEGAPSIPVEEWEHALSLCDQVLRSTELPEPAVSPCGDGTIHLRWTRRDGATVLIEMRGSQFWWSSRVNGQRSRGELASAEEVVGLLKRTLA